MTLVPGLILMWRKSCRNKAASKFKLLISDSLASSSFTSLLLNINIGRTPTNTGLFEMIVWILTTFYTQYTWDRSICFFLYNRTTLQIFVTYLTGALYLHPLWFYKHQHDNRFRSKLFVACQRWWFQWRFWFVPSVPGYLWEEENMMFY